MNEAIRTQAVGADQAEGLTFDLSQIDLERLRDEFAKKVRRKATALQDIRDIVEQKLAAMLARNSSRIDYQLKYEDIVADYNREKDRTTIEETFRQLVELVNSLDEEQKRATKEGLGEDELALFDLLQKDGLDKSARERGNRPAETYSPRSRHGWRTSIGSGRRSRRRPTWRSSFWTRCSPAFRRRPLLPKRRGSSRAMSMPMSGRKP